MSCSAMYSSCASAHLRPSSRVIAWFCPSGSSVTMNVERFERDTTSVWTFRFPYRVGFAFVISAASALASAGEGLSITLAASGSRNSIFATARDLTQAPPDSFLPRACGDSRCPLAVREATVTSPFGRSQSVGAKGGDPHALQDPRLPRGACGGGRDDRFGRTAQRCERAANRPFGQQRRKRRPLIAAGLQSSTPTKSLDSRLFVVSGDCDLGEQAARALGGDDVSLRVEETNGALDCPCRIVRLIREPADLGQIEEHIRALAGGVGGVREADCFARK